jgi:acyl-CoA thioesterase
MPGSQATSTFETATAVTPLGHGRWQAEADPGWFATVGPNGGYTAAIVLRAMASELGDAAREPRSLTLHYTRPLKAGPYWIDVTVERSGRRLSTVTARVEQADKLCLLAVGAFSEDFEGAADYADPAPAAPRPDEVEAVPQDAALVEIAKRFVVRPAIGSPLFSAADEALTGGWIEFREGEPPLDAFALAMLTDAWIPSPFVRLTQPNPAPTVDLTMHFRAPGERVEWPALVVFRSRFAHGGFFEEDGEIWSQDGRLLAQSRQLGLLNT